jgi:hypothetical protein
MAGVSVSSMSPSRLCLNLDLVPGSGVGSGNRARTVGDKSYSG